jgi:hypothetical protein
LKLEEVANRNITYAWETQYRSPEKHELPNLLCECREECKWKKKKEMEERIRNKKLWARRRFVIEVFIK